LFSPQSSPIALPLPPLALSHHSFVTNTLVLPEVLHLSAALRHY
jgi:hypothetical protein